MEKTVFNVVSFSGGKDSTAMLLKMIEEKMDIDCVLFCDTGLEFPQMYEHIDKVRMRWCTKILKSEPREKFIKSLKEHYEIRYYVGLAADEGYRLDRKNNQQANHVHPLVDWNMTEADCLKYCYDRGYDWGGLYEHFKRVSCWCCPLQSLEELRKLRKYFPEQWSQLLEWEKNNFRNFRADYRVDELEKRFAFEEECLAKGMKISGKEFHTMLKERLGR